MGSGSGGCGCYFGWGSSAGKLRWAAFVTLALFSIIFAICWQVEWKDCKVCWFTGETLDTTESGVPVEEFLCRDVTNDDLIVHGKNSALPSNSICFCTVRRSSRRIYELYYYHFIHGLFCHKGSLHVKCFLPPQTQLQFHFFGELAIRYSVE